MYRPRDILRSLLGWVAMACSEITLEPMILMARMSYGADQGIREKLQLLKVEQANKE